MKKLQFTVIILSALFFSTTLLSQDITAKKGSFGVDDVNRIIVWHHPSLDSKIGEKTINTIKFDKTYTLLGDSKTLSYTKSLALKNQETYNLYITNLPLIHISMAGSKINSRKKIPGLFSYFDSEKYVETTMGIRHRGNLSLKFAKKSFDLEFWKDSISKESKDIQFKKMRSDDDWILDAMFNEPLRLRSFVAANLWTKIHKPYYASKEPLAKNGFDVAYVEVFKNNQYYGLYQLSESVDKKQLKLKDSNTNNINGEMYKAESYEGGPNFTKAPETYDNLFPHWIGWETDYPFIDYRSNFENLFQFQNLVVKKTDEEFLRTIAGCFDLNNAVDYYLFVNIIRATDNLGKNYYLGKYDKNEPYFIVPWDLDGTFGIIQEGKQISTTDDILSNGLFKRLLSLNPNDYTAKLKLRWQSLRNNVLSDESLATEIDVIYKKFTHENVYERELLIWQNDLNKISNEAHYKYLKKWLKDRLVFLDLYFQSL